LPRVSSKYSRSTLVHCAGASSCWRNVPSTSFELFFLCSYDLSPLVSNWFILLKTLSLITFWLYCRVTLHLLHSLPLQLSMLVHPPTAFYLFSHSSSPKYLLLHKGGTTFLQNFSKLLLDLCCDASQKVVYFTANYSFATLQM
jgi:hypothetical protein